jgi:hypothetical protein
LLHERKQHGKAEREREREREDTRGTREAFTVAVYPLTWANYICHIK